MAEQFGVTSIRGCCAESYALGPLRHSLLSTSSSCQPTRQKPLMLLSFLRVFFYTETFHCLLDPFFSSCLRVQTTLFGFFEFALQGQYMVLDLASRFSRSSARYLGRCNAPRTIRRTGTAALTFRLCCHKPLLCASASESMSPCGLG
jgi:hypothetical protein